jgi:hypothetical protein
MVWEAEKPDERRATPALDAGDRKKGLVDGPEYRD